MTARRYAFDPTRDQRHKQAVAYPECAAWQTAIELDGLAARTRLDYLRTASQCSDPYAKGGERHWLWWADSRSLRPGLYLRHRRVLRVSMWLLRPRYSWNVRGYGRRWS